MIYRIGVNKWFSAWVETWGDQIIATSPAFAWALGDPINELLCWLYERSITWKVDQ